MNSHLRFVLLSRTPIHFSLSRAHHQLYSFSLKTLTPKRNSNMKHVSVFIAYSGSKILKITYLLQAISILLCRNSYPFFLYTIGSQTTGQLSMSMGPTINTAFITSPLLCPNATLAHSICIAIVCRNYEWHVVLFGGSMAGQQAN